LQHIVTDAFLYFWVVVRIKARNLHIRFGQNYFPRSYGLRRIWRGACQLWALTFDIEKIGFKNFLSHRMGLMGPMGPKRETFVTFQLWLMGPIPSAGVASAAFRVYTNPALQVSRAVTRLTVYRPHQVGNFGQFFLKKLSFFYINIYFLDFVGVRNVITRGHAERRPPL